MNGAGLPDGLRLTRYSVRNTHPALFGTCEDRIAVHAVFGGMPLRTYVVAGETLLISPPDYQGEWPELDAWVTSETGMEVSQGPAS